MVFRASECQRIVNCYYTYSGFLHVPFLVHLSRRDDAYPRPRCRRLERAPEVAKRMKRKGRGEKRQAKALRHTSNELPYGNWQLDTFSEPLTFETEVTLRRINTVWCWILVEAHAHTHTPACHTRNGIFGNTGHSRNAAHRNWVPHIQLSQDTFSLLMIALDRSDASASHVSTESFGMLESIPNKI